MTAPSNSLSNAPRHLARDRARHSFRGPGRRNQRLFAEIYLIYAKNRWLLRPGPWPGAEAVTGPRRGGNQEQTFLIYNSPQRCRSAAPVEQRDLFNCTLDHHDFCSSLVELEE